MAGSAVESGTGGQESSISPLPGDWLLPSLLASARVQCLAHHQCPIQD